MKHGWLAWVTLALGIVLGVMACLDAQEDEAVPAAGQRLAPLNLESGLLDAGAPGEPDAGPPPAPPFNPGFIGSACTQDSDCAFKGGFCLTEEGYGVPGGHCTMKCNGSCPRKAGDPSVTDTFCVPNAVQPNEGLCVARCALHTGGTGCRPDYTCAAMPRFRYPGANHDRLVCMPDLRQEVPETECTKELKALDLMFGRPAVVNERVMLQDENGESVISKTCEIDTPILLASPIRNVDFRENGRKMAENVLVSCKMALALERLSKVLTDLEIVEVEHVGTYNCRGIAGSNRLSAHATGNAVDIRGFERARGTPVSVQADWNGSNAERRRFIRKVAQRIKESRIFSLVLTPADNAAHWDHFHVEIR